MNSKSLSRWISTISVIAGVIVAWFLMDGLEWPVNSKQATDDETAISNPSAEMRSAIEEFPEVAEPLNSVVLSDDAAAKALQQGGQHESLGAALSAARHAVEKIDSASSGSRGADFFAFNPEQRLQAWFNKSGVELACGIRKSDSAEPWSLGFRLRGIGRENLFVPASTGTLSSEGSRVEMDHTNVAVTQWFVNRKEGIEQGFTLRERPEGKSDEVSVSLDIQGNLYPDPMPSGDGIRLLDSKGNEKVRYDGLKAWDATGRDLVARMETSGPTELTLVVQDSDAIYPLTIDPLFANVEARLIQSSDNDNLGSSVALSGDTALIGVPGAASAYVFVHSGTDWTKQAQLAVLDDGPFGTTLALSGNTALVGPHVFVRSGTVWTQQTTLVANDGAKLVGPVAVDGNTALVGPYVFLRSGTVWSQQAKLTSSTGAALDGPVALSGNTALISAALVSGNRKVHVFVRIGSVWSQQTTLDATGLSAWDFYGNSLALSGDTALVGAPEQTTDILGEGSVYFFKRTGTTWTSQGKLSGNTDGDGFGRSIAVTGDTAVIGGPGFNTQTATIAIRSGVVWSKQATLNAPGGLADTGFGSSVAISGTTVLVGAPSSDTTSGKDAGSAYAFVGSGTVWSLQSDFKIDDAPADDRTGCSVSISGDTALVGALNDGFLAPPNFTPALGCAYVFVRRGLVWTQQAKLTPPEVLLRSDFGASVALLGDTALVGAPGESSDGEVYVFVRSGAVWSQQAKLTASPTGNHTNFGGSVAFSGETALIGASSDDTPAHTNAGSAYVFVRNGVTWTEQAKLHATDGAFRDIFGGAVSISGDTALIGSFLNDTPAGTDSGSAYVFRRIGSTWKQEDKLLPSNAAPADFLGIGVALTGGSFSSTATWQNIPIGSRSGSFSFKFRLTPQAALMNGISGLSLGATDDDTDLACAVRLNPSGHFDVNQGSGYAAIHQVPYVAGKSYEVEMMVNTTSSTFSVTIDGVFIAENFNFRAERAGTTRFDTLAIRSGTGSHIISDYGQVTAIIGSLGDDTAVGTDTGSAYVFVRDGIAWNQQAQLIPGDSAVGDQFGRSLALEGDTALIGTHGDDTVAGSDTGSAYVFVRYGTVWNQELKLTAGVDASSGDAFGLPVALSGSTALIGAQSDDTAGSAAGSAYTFLLGELPSITQQPTSKTVLPERFVSFNIKATGYGPLQYQWRKNGSLIPGENGTTLTIASAKVIDQGDYDCVVSNVGGVVTSAPARLSVNALSQFTQVFPPASAEALGFVFVTLSPPGVGGWRFQGEQLWRASGVPVGGLATGDRLIEFRPVPGFIQPPAEIVGVVSGGSATVINRFYHETPSAGTGAIIVTLKPEALAASSVAVADRAQWRLLGEDDTRWRDSETSLGGLAAGSYLVECKSVSGRITPPPSQVLVSDDKVTPRTLTYFISDPNTGTLPSSVPFETVTSDQDQPYAYVGQIRSNVGSSSGFVVKQRVVATAGHVVFDDGTLSAVTGLHWLFQRHSGTHEPKPQTPRGFYLFDGYASARSSPGVIPGEGTVASKNLDVAALYFVANATTNDLNFPGRGGFGGYLASDAPVNEFLTSPAQKILIGYPVNGISAINQGRVHATAPLIGDPPRVVNFTQAFNHTYKTPDIRSSGGMSGGPLCIQFENGNYYPAAVYLGGTGQAVVRAFDSNVVDMFNRAEASGSNDSNNTGGGITLTGVTPFGANADPGAIKVIILPAAAANLGRWGLKPETTNRASGSTYSGRTAGNYVLQLTTISGFLPPAPATVRINGGQLQEFTYTYVPETGPLKPEIAVQQPSGTNIPDPGSVSFGSKLVSSVGNLTLSIKNNGTANLIISAVTKDGTHKADFTVKPLQKTTLEPGASTNLKITFKPSAKGNRKAAIHIKSNANEGNPFDIKLTGKGILKSTARSRFATTPRHPTWTALKVFGSKLETPKSFPTINLMHGPKSEVLPDTALDIWRLANFQTTSNAGDAADNSDPDGDGQNNRSEFAAATNPNNASDVFKILTTTKNATTFTVTAAGKAGRSYILERRSDISSGPWTTVASFGPLSNDASISLTDPATPLNSGFYRLRVSAP